MDRGIDRRRIEMTELMERYGKKSGIELQKILEDEMFNGDEFDKFMCGFAGFAQEEYNALQAENAQLKAQLKAQLTWRPVSEKPEKGQEVIISYVDCYGNRVQSMGSYVSRFNESAEYDDDSVCEYCEEKDEYYLLEGWYESTNNSEYDSWLLKEKVDMWLPIPPAPEGE